ncbi:TadE/TadG family type IV pilus assembly protein [Rhizobium sp. L1K21]|uniref:TadE/TadG family type IV pilus assembly protein n=1 Tax=Rhizobium sp. L1K21 TaxID=2954933 RepID=UPI0020939B57|nr:TadE/TadG family type IV pilus assembly protein [Rhizobium sp. L1K21]
MKSKTTFDRMRISRDGATAVEFAILIVPFLMVLFATMETFLAFTAEHLAANAVDTLARKVRTGEITFGMNRPATDMTEAQFRQAFCDEVSIIIRCSPTEAASPQKLYIDFEQVASFGAIQTDIPRINSDNNSDLDTSAFSFSPGNSAAINSLRVYYRWEITTDLIRPFISNLKPAGETVPSQFLIVATTAFRNEAYP